MNPVRRATVLTHRRPAETGPAITMLLETVPLYLLFEVSVLLASIADRRQRVRPDGVGRLTVN